MSDRDQVHNNLILIKEIVFLRGCVIVVDLIIMDISNFDMILDIDILSRYKVEINAKRRKLF